MPKAKKQKIKEAEFYTADITETQDAISITLPKEALALVDAAQTKKVHWTAINGVVQISGMTPRTVIPMLNLNDFTEPQDAV